MKQYEELFNYSEAIAKRYFRFYTKEFLANAMDLDDLMQESKIATWQTIEKYKHKTLEELKKIIGQAVGWKLNVLRLSSPAVSYKFINLYEFLENTEKYGELIDTENEESNYNVDEDEEITMCSMDKIGELVYEPQKGVDEAIELLDEVKEKCSTKLFDILYKKYIEERTDDEIGKIYGMTRQGVNIYLKREVKKIKKYFC